MTQFADKVLSDVVDWSDETGNFRLAHQSLAELCPVLVPLAALPATDHTILVLTFKHYWTQTRALIDTKIVLVLVVIIIPKALLIRIAHPTIIKLCINMSDPSAPHSQIYRLGFLKLVPS